MQVFQASPAERLVLAVWLRGVGRQECISISNLGCRSVSTIQISKTSFFFFFPMGAPLYMNHRHGLHDLFVLNRTCTCLLYLAFAVWEQTLILLEVTLINVSGNEASAVTHPRTPTLDGTVHTGIHTRVSSHVNSLKLIRIFFLFFFLSMFNNYHISAHCTLCHLLGAWAHAHDAHRCMHVHTDCQMPGINKSALPSITEFAAYHYQFAGRG